MTSDIHRVISTTPAPSTTPAGPTTANGRGTFPLRADDLAAVLRPLPDATNLPPAVYTAPEVWRIEQEEIFGRMWLCVGRHEDIPAAGQFFTRRIGDESLLVVRGSDGEARAFYNVCRHRGACLVQKDSGKAKAFRCNYHAWTYDTSGQLVAAPLMEERAGFRPEDWPLNPVRLESWGGFLFVNLDEGAPALAAAMADFPDLSRYGLEGLRRAHRIVYDVAANWKVLCENYSECYHCALVHPQLNRISDYRSGGRSVVGACYNGGPMELNEGMTTMSMSGASGFPVIDGLDEQDRRLVHYYNFYPHLLIGLNPDYVLVHRVWPRGPGRSEVICDWLFPPSTIEMAGFDPREVVEFWDTTNRQDWKLCEMVQEAAVSRGARPGPYHPAETCVHAFDSWFVRTLQDRLAAIAD